MDRQTVVRSLSLRIRICARLVIDLMLQVEGCLDAILHHLAPLESVAT